MTSVVKSKLTDLKREIHMGRATAISVDDIDHYIRRGELVSARKSLRDLCSQKVSREVLWRVAALCRRAGLVPLAVKLLHPFVSPNRKSAQTSSENEIIQYAASLIHLGATEEGLALIKPLDFKTVPEILKINAFALMAQWNYKDAIPLLRSYIDSKGTDAYQKLVAEVNLSAALIVICEYCHAEALLKHLLENTRKNKYTLLQANVLELLAQSAISQSNWTKAESFLSRASSILKDSGILDEFFIKKWKVFSQVFRTGANAASIHALKLLKIDATQRKHWESCRDCDRALAIATRNEQLFMHLHFGTPFEGFRKALVEAFPNPPQIASSYLWSPGGSNNVGAVLDLANCKLNNAHKDLDVGSPQHRLLQILISDFYRPFRIASIHQKLYPGEYYNPQSSPMRVYQVVLRLRKLLKVQRIPIQIEEIFGDYRISPESTCAIEINFSSQIGDRLSWAMQRLQDRWYRREFSVCEASQEIQTSRATALRFLNEVVKKGNCMRLGTGAATKYRFVA